MRLLGIVHAFNEEDCIGNAISMLTRSGHEVHAFDHGSVDATAEVIRSFGGTVTYHDLDRKQIPIMDDQRRPLSDLWEHIGSFINERAEDFDWVTWMDADELLRDHEGALLSRKALERARETGITVISPRLRNFWMTSSDPTAEAEPNYLLRLRHCETIGRPIKGCPRCWLPALTGDPRKMTRGRHRKDNHWALGPGMRIERRWTLDHYPIRTVEQGRRKVLHDRPWGPPQYRKLKGKRLGRLVRRATGMQRVRYREFPEWARPSSS
jgi:glycosyltransferase involved in cell wall biosynthesis